MHHKTRLVPTLLVGPDRTTQPDSATSASISSRSRRLFIFYTLCSLLHSRLPSPEPQPQSLRRSELTPTPPPPPPARGRRSAATCRVQPPTTRTRAPGGQGGKARPQEAKNPLKNQEHAARHRSAHGDATATTCSSRRGSCSQRAHLPQLLAGLGQSVKRGAYEWLASAALRQGKAFGYATAAATTTMMSHPSFRFLSVSGREVAWIRVKTASRSSTCPLRQQTPSARKITPSASNDSWKTLGASPRFVR